MFLAVPLCGRSQCFSLKLVTTSLSLFPETRFARAMFGLLSLKCRRLSTFFVVVAESSITLQAILVLTTTEILSWFTLTVGLTVAASQAHWTWLQSSREIRFESSSLCCTVQRVSSDENNPSERISSSQTSWSRCTLQTKLGSSVKKTQEALIIRIAHKTINNEKFMLLLLVVNSNCYCGHLRIKNEAGLKSNFAFSRLHFLMQCLHPLQSCLQRKQLWIDWTASHLTTVDEA